MSEENTKTENTEVTATEAAVNEALSAEPSGITVDDFYSKLSERVSAYNARLLMHSVMIGSGLNTKKQGMLNKEEAKTVCLELIKKGGPAFQVGKAMYSQVQ